MNKEQLIASVTNEAQDLQKEMNELQNQFNQRKERLIKLSGALEVLSALNDSKPENPLEKVIEETPDHSSAMSALSSIGA